MSMLNNKYDSSDDFDSLQKGIIQFKIGVPNGFPQRKVFKLVSNINTVKRRLSVEKAEQYRLRML